MKVKKPLVITGIIELLIGILLLIVLLVSEGNGVLTWISTILILLFGLVSTIIAAAGS